MRDWICLHEKTGKPGLGYIVFRNMFIAGKAAVKRVLFEGLTKINKMSSV